MSQYPGGMPVPDPNAIQVLSIDTSTGDVQIRWGDECFEANWGESGLGHVPREVEVVEATIRSIAALAPVEYRAALIEDGARRDCKAFEKASSWLPTLLIGGLAVGFFILRKR